MNVSEMILSLKGAIAISNSYDFWLARKDIRFEYKELKDTFEKIYKGKTKIFHRLRLKLLL